MRTLPGWPGLEHADGAPLDRVLVHGQAVGAERRGARPAGRRELVVVGSVVLHPEDDLPRRQARGAVMWKSRSVTCARAT